MDHRRYTMPTLCWHHLPFNSRQYTDERIICLPVRCSAVLCLPTILMFHCYIVARLTAISRHYHCDSRTANTLTDVADTLCVPDACNGYLAFRWLCRPTPVRGTVAACRLLRGRWCYLFVMLQNAPLIEPAPYPPRVLSLPLYGARISHAPSWRGRHYPPTPASCGRRYTWFM